MHPGPMNRGVEIDLRRRRRPAVRDPPPGRQWRSSAHGRACAARGSARDARPVSADARAPRHDPPRGRRRPRSPGIRRRPVRDASRGAALCRCGNAGKLHPPDLRARPADAPAALDHAYEPRRRRWVEVLYKVVGHGLAELALRRPGESLSCLGPIGRGFTAARSAATPAPRRRRRRHPADGVPRRVARRGSRQLAAARADGLGTALPLRPRRVAAAGAGHAGGRDAPRCRCSSISAFPQRLASLSGFPGCHRGYVTELADAWLGVARRGRACRSRDLHLRPARHAGRGRRPRAPTRRALPGFARGKHGLRRRRLRRMHRPRPDAGRAGDETRLRRRPGLRRRDRLQRLIPATARTRHSSKDRSSLRGPATARARAERYRAGKRRAGSERANAVPRSERGVPGAPGHARHHPKLMRASRFVRESALFSASSMSIRPSL